MARWTLLRFCILAIGVTITAGCTALDLKETMHWPFVEEKPEKPDKIVAIWTDTVLYKPNRPTVRGFGGRLMFFKNDGDTPVKVDGTLVVYAFDETNRDPANARPDRKYVFPPEQLPSHYSKAKSGKSEIGHSYSVWLPWDEVGGVAKEISLIVRFQPKDGSKVVVGDLARQLLPGKPSEVAKMSPSDTNTPQKQMPRESQAVQQTSYTCDAGLSPVQSTREQESHSRRMTTTTITVPSATARGLLAGNTANCGPALNVPSGQASSNQLGSNSVALGVAGSLSAGAEAVNDDAANDSNLSAKTAVATGVARFSGHGSPVGNARFNQCPHNTRLANKSFRQPSVNSAAEKTPPPFPCLPAAQNY